MPKAFRPLREGEPVGVAALSGPVDPDRLERGLSLLRSSGREVLEAPNLRRCDGYLAGSDRERVEGLVDLLDRRVRLIFAARGGYGVTRILDDLPWRRLVDSQVSFVGYSDLTALMNPLVERGGAEQFHGPVVSEFDGLSGGFEDLMALLEGRRSASMAFDGTAVVRPGCVSGPACGGNLTLLAALAGTPYHLSLEGKVLFLEEVNESMYRLDRLLTQVRSSGILRGVKALISGDLQGCEGESGEAWKALLLEAASPEAVVVERLPFGHGKDNVAFPIGATVEVDTRRGHLVWRR